LSFPAGRHQGTFQVKEGLQDEFSIAAALADLVSSSSGANLPTGAPHLGVLTSVAVIESAHGRRFMSAFESVTKSIKEWHTQLLPTELKYRDSLAAFLRERLRDAKVETEYRHSGTTIDIYVKQSGFFGSSEVFIELKRNFLHKAQLDRLVGQIESLQPDKNAIVVILCGETNPMLVTRYKEKYKIRDDDFVVYGGLMAVVVKEDAGKVEK
jgi:hypothetical protein